MYKASSINSDLLQNPGIPIEERQKALDRAFADPGIPDSQNTTKSFWLKDAHPDLANTQSATLPSHTDIVIIGSGITGASITKTLLEVPDASGTDISRRPSIVVLEAREVCSGATGRNGGHMLESGEYFRELAERVGLEAARKIMRLRLAHTDEMLQVSQDLGLVDCAQTRKVQFLSAYFDELRWREAVDNIKLFKETMPTEAAEFQIIQKNDIPENFRLPHAIGVIAGPAGAIWPYKFVTGIFARLRRHYRDRLTIETSTPVTRILRTHVVRKHDDLSLYHVVTPRGTILARHVIHCTNAHAAHLLPGLRGCIIPLRGQMSAQTPGDSFAPQGSHHSWLFNYERGFDYLTQLPLSKHSNNEMMFGGGFSQGEQHGIADFGVARDDKLSLYADIHLSGALGAIFGHDQWGTTTASLPIKSMWTGNMGLSADGFPWVGRVPKIAIIDTGPIELHQSVPDCGGDCEFPIREVIESDDYAKQSIKGGEWISAAFSGEGMVHAWRCGIALAGMLRDSDPGMFGKTSTATNQDYASGYTNWFPEEFLVTEERIRTSVLPRTLGHGSDVVDGHHLDKVDDRSEHLEDWVCI